MTAPELAFAAPVRKFLSHQSELQKTRRGVFMSPRGRAYKRRLTAAAHAAVRLHGLTAPVFAEGDLRLDLEFAYAGQARQPVGSVRRRGVRPDLANLYKLAEDSFNGVLFTDDGQVAEARLTKTHDGSLAAPELRVRVMRLGDDFEAGERLV